MLKLSELPPPIVFLYIILIMLDRLTTDASLWILVILRCSVIILSSCFHQMLNFTLQFYFRGVFQMSLCFWLSQKGLNFWPASCTVPYVISTLHPNFLFSRLAQVNFLMIQHSSAPVVLIGLQYFNYPCLYSHFFVRGSCVKKKNGSYIPAGWYCRWNF